MKHSVPGYPTDVARRHLERLGRSLKDIPWTAQALLEEVLEQLSASLGELQLAADELRERNEELASAKRALETERQRYRDLFESASDGYLVTTPAGTIQEVNPAAAALLRREPESLGGKPLALLLQKQGSLRRLLSDLKQGLEPSGASGWEVDLRRSDGTHFPALLHVTTIRDAGRLVELRWLIRDLTARKEAEQALQRWVRLFEDAHRGVVVGSGDGKTLEMMNPAFARMHGYTVQELTGRPIHELFPPECRADLAEHIRIAHEQGHCEFESRHVRKDGTVFPVRIDVTAVRDAAGRVLYRVVHVEDITEHKHAQDAILRTNEELELRVAQRTAELTVAIEDLKNEVGQRTRAEESLRARARQQEAIVQLGLRALAGTKPDKLMDDAVAFAAETLGVDCVKVLELLSDGGTFAVIAGVGWKEGLVGHATVAAHTDSQAGYTLLCSEPVVVEDLGAETRFKTTPLLKDHGLVSGMSVVIHGRKRPFGVLCAHTDRRRTFTKDDTRFLQAVANVLGTAIERERGDAALRQIEWLLTETSKPAATLREAHEPDYGSLVQLNTHRELLDSVGKDVLAELADGYLDLLDTSVAVFERSGDYALNTASSPWCRFLSHASRALCGGSSNKAAMESGRWHCHESCWSESSRVCAETGEPADIECRGGIRIYAVPIRAGADVVGSINFGYGDPPTHPEKLQEIAARYHVSVDALRQKAEAYESRPPFILDIAKTRLLGSAKLIGTMVERKRFEDQLLDTVIERTRAETEQQKFVSLVENSSDFIGMASLRGRMLFVNPAGRRLVGLDRQEAVIGTYLSQYWTDETWTRIEQVALPAVMADGRWEGDGQLRHFKGHHTVDVELNLFVVKHPHTDEPLCLAMVQRDVTERKRVDRLKGEFISTVSHELRTPLTSIRGALGLIASGVSGVLPPKAQTLVEIAYRNSERLVRLVNDILDIDKIEAGKMVLTLRPVEVMPLVEQALTANRAYAEEFDVHWRVVESLPDARVWADADRFTQVMTNLLSNAAKFSPPSDQVAISVSRRERMIRVAVTDHGPGIPEPFRGRVFQKFAQADASDARQKGGTGLGLSIAKAIVEKMAGHIAFETAPARGTTFYFELPEWRG
jgi:PAS domain S-box-containing protein